MVCFLPHFLILDNPLPDPGSLVSLLLPDLWKVNCSSRGHGLCSSRVRWGWGGSFAKHRSVTVTALPSVPLPQPSLCVLPLPPPEQRAFWGPPSSRPSPTQVGRLRSCRPSGLPGSHVFQPARIHSLQAQQPEWSRIVYRGVEGQARVGPPPGLSRGGPDSPAAPAPSSAPGTAHRGETGCM